MEVLRSFPRPTMLTKASNFERGSPLCSLEKKKKKYNLPYFFRAFYISKVNTLLKGCFEFHTNSYNFIGLDCWPLIFDPDFHLFGVRTRIIAQPRPYTRNMTTEIKEMKINLSSHSSFDIVNIKLVNVSQKAMWYRKSWCTLKSNLCYENVPIWQYIISTLLFLFQTKLKNKRLSLFIKLLEARGLGHGGC